MAWRQLGLANCALGAPLGKTRRGGCPPALQLNVGRRSEGCGALSPPPCLLDGWGTSTTAGKDLADFPSEGSCGFSEPRKFSAGAETEACVIQCLGNRGEGLSPPRVKAQRRPQQGVNVSKAALPSSGRSSFPGPSSVEDGQVRLDSPLPAMIVPGVLPSLDESGGR